MTSLLKAAPSERDEISALQYSRSCAFKTPKDVDRATIIELPSVH